VVVQNTEGFRQGGEDFGGDEVDKVGEVFGVVGCIGNRVRDGCGRLLLGLGPAGGLGGTRGGGGAGEVLDKNRGDAVAKLLVV